jgi:hypothetical protein
VINALLVRWAKGWHEVTDPGAIELYGRHEGTLALGVEQSVAEVERVAAGQLAAGPREEIAVDLDPTGPADTPYTAFAVADTVTVPGLAGGPTQERVTALTVAEDENGRLSWVPELKDVLLTQDERTEQAIARMANGALAGTSPVASPMPHYVTPAPIPGSGGAPTPGPGAALPLAVYRGETSVNQFSDVELHPSVTRYINGADALFHFDSGEAFGYKFWHPGYVLVTAHYTWVSTLGTPAGQVWTHIDLQDMDGASYVLFSQGAYDLGPVLPPSQPNFGYSGSRMVETGAHASFQPYAYQDYSATPVVVTWSLSMLVISHA